LAAPIVTDPIRFVYFDLGNVLATFSVDRACRNVSDRWAVSPEDVRRVVWDSGLQDRFEHGEVAADRFAAEVRRSLGLDASSAPTDELLDRLSDMFDPILEMIDLVDAVRATGVDMGILSNTCEAHWRWLVRSGYAALRGPWNRVILSYEHGAMKPAESIYRVAGEAAGHPVGSILFFDDRADNVLAAKAGGWQAHRFTDAGSAREVLTMSGVLD
jgi:HAD superfamily hydrolase (TIGR01509 family)